MKHLCSVCRKSFDRKEVKRINKKWICKKCSKEKRKLKRENLKRNVLKITKEQESKENELISKNYKKKYQEENREKINKYHRDCYKKKREENKETPELKIKGSKIRRVSRKLHYYLTTEEKNILYLKYVKSGFDKEEIKQRLINIKTYLKEFIKKLEEKKELEETINIKFKEEFAKLLEQE